VTFLTVYHDVLAPLTKNTSRDVLTEGVKRHLGRIGPWLGWLLRGALVLVSTEERMEGMEDSVLAHDHDPVMPDHPAIVTVSR